MKPPVILEISRHGSASFIYATCAEATDMFSRRMRELPLEEDHGAETVAPSCTAHCELRKRMELR